MVQVCLYLLPLSLCPLSYFPLCLVDEGIGALRGVDRSALGFAVPNAAELRFEDKANLMQSIKNTLQGLAVRHIDMLESLKPKVRKRVEVLREIQL